MLAYRYGERMIIKWITADEFGELEGQESSGNGLDSFLKTPEEEKEYRVDYNSLTPAQKKKLPGMDGDFKVYVNEKSRPPPSLKPKIIKERFYPKKDIIPLIKMILKERDRDKVFQALVKENISPIVLGIWLIRPFSASSEAAEILAESEKYVYNSRTYYSIIASKFKPGNPDVKFRFPKKIRG